MTEEKKPQQEPDAVGSELSGGLGRFRSLRWRRAERRLAGLKARLLATQSLIDLCADRVPGQLVRDAQDIPQRIAELEVLISQLTA